MVNYRINITFLNGRRGETPKQKHPDSRRSTLRRDQEIAPTEDM